MDSAKKCKNEHSLFTQHCVTSHLFLATVHKVLVTSLDPLPISSTSRHNNNYIEHSNISCKHLQSELGIICSQWLTVRSEDKTHNIETLIKACFICYGREKKEQKCNIGFLLLSRKHES